MNPRLHARALARVRGFSVAESLVGVALLSIVGTSMMLTFGSALKTGADSADLVLAEGLAAHLLSEISLQRYKEPGQPWNHPVLGPEAGEQSRADFDDIDDYHHYVASPPADRWGRPLGLNDGQGGLRPLDARLPVQKLNQWRFRVTVRYADANDLTMRSAAPTLYRRVTVFVDRLDGVWQNVTQADTLIGYAETDMN